MNTTFTRHIEFRLTYNRQYLSINANMPIFLWQWFVQTVFYLIKWNFIWTRFTLRTSNTICVIKSSNERLSCENKRNNYYSLFKFSWNSTSGNWETKTISNANTHHRLHMSFVRKRLRNLLGNVKICLQTNVPILNGIFVIFLHHILLI